MNTKTLKNAVLVVLFVILAPLILVGVTSLGNSLAGKSKATQVQTTEQQAAKVPEENKATTNNDIPKANQERISNESTQQQNNNNNDESNQNQNAQVSTNPTVGQDYVIKAGDSLFVIASTAYGEANAQAGVDKIKEANNIDNNNIAAGQRIQIPRL